MDVRYATRRDGARTAFAILGRGPPLVVPPSYVTHLEWTQVDTYVRSFYARLAERFSVVLYDQHGVGLSDRERSDFTIRDDLLDLEAVVAAQGLDRFAMFGISTGGMVALLYVSQHPEHVTRMVLYGTSAGFAPGEHPRFEAAQKAVVELVRVNWGLGSRVVANSFFPSSTPADVLDSFARLQRMAASAETAAKLIEHLYDVDLRAAARGIQTPALVLHRRGDQNIPFAAGRELASLLPNASLTALEGDIHYPAYGDADSVLDSAIAFLADESRIGPITPPPARTSAPARLSAREVEVLRLLAQGKTNQEIAEALVISLNTVAHHVTNILNKAGLSNRTEAAAYAHRHGLV